MKIRASSTACEQVGEVTDDVGFGRSIGAEGTCVILVEMELEGT